MQAVLLGIAEVRWFARCFVLSAIFLTSQPSFACKQIIDDERLRLRCILSSVDGKVVPASEIANLDSSLKKLGHTEGLGLPSRAPDHILVPSFGISTSFERNLNDGSPNKPLQLGENFFYPSDYQPQLDDLVISASPKLSGRSLYGVERYIQVELGYQKGSGIKYGFDLERTYVDLCSKNQIKEWTYIDFCFLKNGIKKRKSQTTEAQHTITVEKITPVSNLIQSTARIAVLSKSTNGTNQNGVNFGFGVISVLGYSRADFSDLSTATNVQLANRSRSISHTLEIKNHLVMLSHTNTWSSGGKILGYPWSELNSVNRLTLWINNQMTVTVGKINNKSNIDFFDYTHPIFQVGFSRPF